MSNTYAVLRYIVHSLDCTLGSAENASVCQRLYEYSTVTCFSCHVQRLLLTYLLASENGGYSILIILWWRNFWSTASFMHCNAVGVKLAATVWARDAAVHRCLACSLVLCRRIKTATLVCEHKPEAYLTQHVQKIFSCKLTRCWHSRIYDKIITNVLRLATL